MESINVPGGYLAYDEIGAGPAVVFVHAGCADRRMWHAQMPAVSDRYRAVRYDWRGYGDSPDMTGEFAHHEDLLSLLDGLAIRSAVLVGCSDGGRIAVDAALTAPHRIEGLVLVAAGLSGHVWPQSMMIRYQERVHSSIGVERLRQYRSGEVAAIDDAELARYSAAETEYLVAGPDRTRSDLAHNVWSLAYDMDRRLNQRSWTVVQSQPTAIDPPASERLGEIAAPALIISGLCDVPEIRDVSDVLQQGIPSARRIDIPDAGHLPPLEHPEQFNAALLNFLADLT